jgi:hypothetical protein
VKLSDRAQLGIVVAACALAAAGAAYATSKIRHSHSTASGLTPGYVGAQARGWDGRPFGLRQRDTLSVAAGSLGISQESLFDELRSGKSLAEIANAASGKSADGLIDALVKDAEAGLTEDQVSRFGDELKARITALVNGSFRHPFFPGPPRI